MGGAQCRTVNGSSCTDLTPIPDDNIAGLWYFLVDVVLIGCKTKSISSYYCTALYNAVITYYGFRIYFSSKYKIAWFVDRKRCPYI